MIYDLVVAAIREQVKKMEASERREMEEEEAEERVENVKFRV